MVAALVEAGLVAREPDPADRRVAWVRVTSEGAKLVNHSRKRKDEFLAKRMRSLDAHELDVLEEAAALLERLTEGSA
jgi:DNA-binding MarR family transcriptional regulator